jgi:hypothetical protein
MGSDTQETQGHERDHDGRTVEEQSRTWSHAGPQRHTSAHTCPRPALDSGGRTPYVGLRYPSGSSTSAYDGLLR